MYGCLHGSWSLLGEIVFQYDAFDETDGREERRECTAETRNVSKWFPRRIAVASDKPRNLVHWGT